MPTPALCDSGVTGDFDKARCECFDAFKSCNVHFTH